MRFWLLLLLLTLAAPSMADGLSLAQLVQDKSVLFLGETHTSATDHKGQLEILQSLRESESRPIVPVLEMFDERSADTLRRFVEGSDLEPAFWAEQWGHPYELYKPILDWIKESKMDLTHLRPDPERTKRIREGQAIPEFQRLGDFYLGPPAYREFMAEVAAQHFPKEMKLTDNIVNKYFLIQCFWDEYMSWRVAQLKEQNPEALLVILVGNGHLRRDFGIPRRLKRRLPEVKFATVGFEKNANWDPDLVWIPGN